MPGFPVSSSTFSSSRWLLIFFAILTVPTVGFLAASEWLVRVRVLPHDGFEVIAERLHDSTQSNAAFGDSHVAAVNAYDTADFINLGIGATTIRKMDQRVRYYFSKNKPGQVIIQADPHLLAEYRLEAHGSYVPEDYSNLRSRALDPRHRGFMLKYWSVELASAPIKVPSYDDLWQAAQSLRQDAPKPAENVQPSPPAPSPVAAKASLRFNALMDSEILTHTPAHDFEDRDEATIYREMIKFLIGRGAKVCLVNYPVDQFYRVRADAIPAFAAARKFFEDTAKANRIPYVSFWDRFDDPSMYQNSDHVNQQGAVIIARESRAACFGK